MAERHIKANVVNLIKEKTMLEIALLIITKRRMKISVFL